MSAKLKNYFPMLKERSELLSEIRARSDLSALFSQWTEEQQEEFLDFMTGVCGVKLLYDAFFKEIMNPEYAPERLNEFLSLLLNTEVKILSVLPNDSTRIADEHSLLIMDIVIQMADGSLANVEVQKIGYLFPGQRSACYSSDLLLRQYKRVRGEKGKSFSYKDIKNVYTVVLFEKSPKIFHSFPDQYCHYFEQQSNTGLKLTLLQKYLFLPLDIFLKKQQNKVIKSKLDAWLTFFSSDDPELILRLIEEWPEFRPLYNDVYEMCRNVEGVMGLFSKELLELDRNTVQYMIDEMQNEIDAQRKELSDLSETILQQKSVIAELEERLKQAEKPAVL